MGLIMLVLIGIVPATYALNMGSSEADITAVVAAARALHDELESPEINNLMTALKQEYEATTRVEKLRRSDAVAAGIEPYGNFEDDLFGFELRHPGVARDLVRPYPQADAVLATLDPLPLVKELMTSLEGKKSFTDLEHDDRWKVRTHLVELGVSVRTLVRTFGDKMAEDRRKVLSSLAGKLAKPVEYVPEWVKMGVALCLGLGTMVGWKRIVVTVGEKIGKSHLTYAQGASAELVAATTIGLADGFGLPVSTTHVLSSGVAGTMWANKSGIQAETVRDIALAWILTLPAVIILSGLLYWLATLFVG